MYVWFLIPLCSVLLYPECHLLKCLKSRCPLLTNCTISRQHESFPCAGNCATSSGWSATNLMLTKRKKCHMAPYCADLKTLMLLPFFCIWSLIPLVSKIYSLSGNFTQFISHIAQWGGRLIVNHLYQVLMTGWRHIFVGFFFLELKVCSNVLFFLSQATVKGGGRDVRTYNDKLV